MTDMPGGLIRYTLILFVITAFFGCTSESCDDATESYVNMSLQFTDDETKTKVDSITVFGLPFPDDLLYDTVSASVIKLPLDPSSDYATFVIRQGQTEDTVTIEYDSRVKFISKACGYSFYYTITAITSTNNKIDNILIIDSDVNPGDKENLRTFY